MKKLLLLLALSILLVGCSQKTEKPQEQTQEKPQPETLDLKESSDETDLGLDNALKELELLDK